MNLNENNFTSRVWWALIEEMMVCCSIINHVNALHV